MKSTLAALAVLLSSLVSAHAVTTSAAHAVTTSTSAFNYFTDANGNVGAIFAVRQTDPATNVTTTTLSYTFCVQTTAASCQEGSGTIPNGAFLGTLTSSIHRADVLNLLADTTQPGFVNQLCNAPDQLGGCEQGMSPATGGVIQIHYVKKLGSVQIFTTNDFEESNYKVTLNSTDAINQFAGTATGSIFGISVSELGNLAFRDAPQRKRHARSEVTNRTGQGSGFAGFGAADCASPGEIAEARPIKVADGLSRLSMS